MIKLKTLQIKNFKSFQDVTIHLDPDFNVFTGINNSGKTNLLEAISLWHECFNLLIRQAGRSYKDLYSRGDYILGTTQEKYFAYQQVKTVRSSSMEDIFYQCNSRSSINLIANFTKETGEELEIGFSIKTSGSNYVIELINYGSYDFPKFNQFFSNFPQPISASFASPVAAIREYERFLTQPQVIESIQKRQSVEVIRNRLYTLYRDSGARRDSQLYNNFIRDLSYILFDSTHQIEFSIESDFREHVNIVVNHKTNARDTTKDLSLLGSGTLQIIIILLNLYSAEQEFDLNLVFFDEPDSHIHRDIQKRLIEILTRFSDVNQIFLTTHNESVIRQTPFHQLFHLENRPQANYNALSQQAPQEVNSHFSGIFPLATNSIIRSLGYSSGLDFVNAIEADRILIVEGQDDAQALHILLQKAVIPRNTKKYVFWVLGGVSKVFDEILNYKVIFEQIKNERTLWEKTTLIFDKDFLTNQHQEGIMQAFKDKLNLDTYIIPTYTFESILLRDLQILVQLLFRWANKYKSPLSCSDQGLLNSLQANYFQLKDVLQEKYSNNTDVIYRYRSVRDKLKNVLGNKNNVIKQDDIQITEMFRKYSTDLMDSQEFFKLADKFHVQQVIHSTLDSYGIAFDIETDFLNLLNCVDRSTWFPDWNFITRL